MKYAGNYRLVTNPRAKMSHRLRALLKRQALADRRRPCNCASGYAAPTAAVTPSDYAAALDDFQTKGGAK